MEPTIKTLATKEDIANVCKEIGEAKSDAIKWMFIFWIGQGAMLAILLLFLKK